MTRAPYTPQAPNYDCPGCLEHASLVISRSQAFCSTHNCNVFMFTPDAPNQGMDDPGLIDLNFMDPKSE
jgi:hypothetical protein